MVWLSDDSDKASLLVTSICQKSSYEHSITPALDTAAPLFYYDSSWPNAHELCCDTLKGQQESLFVVDLPLVARDSLTTASQGTLAAADFGDDEVVPLTDSHSNEEIGAAYGA